MRLGLSTVLTAALAVGLMACSSSTGDGAGGAGGSGSGGDDSSTSQGGGGTGGDDTTVGQGGAGGGDTGDGTCETEIVANDAECSDVDCTGLLFEEGGDVFCTAIGCETAADCGTADVDCAPVTDDAGNETGACVFSCADGASCPQGFVCDDGTTGEGTLYCLPG